MTKAVLSIKGMSCSACSSGLEKYLNKKAGIVNVSVNLVLAQAMIEYEDIITIDDINLYIQEAGFESLGIYKEDDEDKVDKKKKIIFLIYSFLAALVLYISMGSMIGLPMIPFLDLNRYPINYTFSLLLMSVLFIFYGIDIIKSGFKNLFHKIPNMDTLVTLGILSSLIYSFYSTIMIINRDYIYVHNLYYESVAIIIYFIKLGRFIDSKSKERTKEAIKELVQITPDYALIKLGDTEKNVTIDSVRKGDILIVKPGMRVAVDGEIIKGEGHFDEAFLTGESEAVKKKVSDKIMAGSINYDGYIEYEAVGIGKDSTISEIVRLVVSATNTKAPISRIADKVCSYFVPIIILIAIMTFICYWVIENNINVAIDSFISVLVVACPCALGLATPLAIVVSTGVCAKSGILVKTSEILENAHKVDTIVFDKTGTLTYGNLRISKIYNYSGYSDTKLLEIVASVEDKSSHPISKAFEDYTRYNKITLKEIEDFRDIPGLGLRALVDGRVVYLGNNKILKKLKIKNIYSEIEDELSLVGNSIVYVIEDDKIIGLIGVSDIIRESSKKVVEKLKSYKKEVIMLTGDNSIVAKVIADELGIEKVISNVMPNEKVMEIEKIIKQGKKVMMIGDGINDAPSLATANIGLSIKSGTDIASSVADVILMNDNLLKIVDLLNISKKTISNIKQNLFWAFFYNVCMIPIAIGVLRPFQIEINPMLASLAMTISSVTVMLNALRLKRNNWKG